MKQKFRRFLIVGSVNTLINFVLFNLLFIILPLTIIYANLAAQSISLIIGFYLHTNLVFRTNVDQNSQLSMLKFAISTIFSQLIVQSFVIYYFSQVFLWPGYIFYQLTIYFGVNINQELALANFAKIMAVGISILVNFLLYDRFVFKNSRKLNTNTSSVEA